MERAVSDHPKVKRKANVNVRLLSIFGDNGIEMDVIFWARIKPGELNFLKVIFVSKLTRFRENGIVVPFPQRTISYLNKDPKSQENQAELQKDNESIVIVDLF
ncbi:MAG: hypothetical protein R2799_08530 [Crocinitomicaceae bacterium]